MKYSDILVILILIIIVLLSFYKSGINENFCNKKISCINKIIDYNKNISLCEKTENPNKCYFAISYKDKKNYCYLIKNKSYYYSCYNELSKYNITYCNFSTEVQKCYILRAIDKKDSKICNLTNNTEYCLYSLAYNLKNESLCNDAGKYKEICYKKILENLEQNKNITN